MSADLSFIIAMCIYGSMGIFVTNIHMSNIHIVLIRSGIGSLLLYMVLKIKKKSIFTSALRKNIIKMALCGISMGLASIFLFESYRLISVSVATLTYYLGPIMLLILSSILLNENINKFTWLGIILAMIGMFILNYQNLNLENLNFGVIYALLAALFYSILMFLNRTIDGEIDGLNLSFIQLFFSFLFLTLYCVIFNFRIDLISVKENLKLLFIVCLFHTALANYMYFNSISNMSVEKIALYSYLDTIVAVILSILILKESLNFSKSIGGILIIFGTLIGQKAQKEGG